MLAISIDVGLRILHAGEEGLAIVQDGLVPRGRDSDFGQTSYFGGVIVLLASSSLRL